MNEGYKTKNIEWTEVRAMHEPDVELITAGTNAIWVLVRNGHRDATIFWGGQVAREAHAWLGSKQFTRCACGACGIRTSDSKLGSFCTTHAIELDRRVRRLGTFKDMDDAIRWAMKSPELAGRLTNLWRFDARSTYHLLTHRVARAIGETVREASCLWDELMGEVDKMEARS